jgi:hypothetical protein
MVAATFPHMGATLWFETGSSPEEESEFVREE